ncbi:MAG: hypothetical protein Q9192_005821 [Flavoplaca navasiana]
MSTPREEERDVIDFLGTPPPPSPPPHPLRPVKLGSIVDHWSTDYLEKAYPKFERRGIAHLINPTLVTMDDFLSNRPGFSSSRKSNTSRGTSATFDSLMDSLSSSTSGAPGPSQPSGQSTGSSGFTAVNDQSSMPGPSQPPGQSAGSSLPTTVDDQQDNFGELPHVEEEKIKIGSAIYDPAFERLPPEQKAAAIRRRAACTQDLVREGKDIYRDGMVLNKAPTGQAQLVSSHFQYPIYNWFPYSDDDPMFVNPHLSGVRLQDFHVAKLFIAAKGNFSVLAAIHNETFTKEGLRSGRAPCGRGAVVFTQKGWQWVVMGNKILWGDYGDRHGSQADEVDGEPFNKRSRGLRAWGKVPMDIVNKIPSEDNLRGIRLTWNRQPAPWVVRVIEDSKLDILEPAEKPKFPLLELGLVTPSKKGKQLPQVTGENNRIATARRQIFPGFHDKTRPLPTQQPTTAQISASNFYTRYDLKSIINSNHFWAHPTMSICQIRLVVAYPQLYSLSTLNHLIRSDPGSYSEDKAFQHDIKELRDLAWAADRVDEGNLPHDSQAAKTVDSSSAQPSLTSSRFSSPYAAPPSFRWPLDTKSTQHHRGNSMPSLAPDEPSKEDLSQQAADLKRPRTSIFGPSPEDPGLGHGSQNPGRSSSMSDLVQSHEFNKEMTLGASQPLTGSLPGGNLGVDRGLQNLAHSPGKQMSPAPTDQTMHAGYKFQARTGLQSLRHLTRISASPEPSSESQIQAHANPSVADSLNKQKLIQCYAGAAYSGERLDACVNILNDGIMDGIRAVRLCRPLLEAVVKRDSTAFTNARDQLTPEKFKQFSDLYQRMKVRHEKAGAMREKLAKGLDEREGDIIFTHGAEPDYETGKEILDLINQVKGIEEGGPDFDLGEFLKVIKKEDEDELTL